MNILLCSRSLRLLPLAFGYEYQRVNQDYFSVYTVSSSWSLVFLLRLFDIVVSDRLNFAPGSDLRDAFQDRARAAGQQNAASCRLIKASQLMPVQKDEINIVGMFFFLKAVGPRRDDLRLIVCIRAFREWDEVAKHGPIAVNSRWV